MDWPRTPVELSRWFAPRFCPRVDCSEHHHRGDGYRFHHKGVYVTPRGHIVHRFRCLTCHGSFSQMTFSFSYYLKRPELVIPIAKALVAGSAHRQIARSLACAPSTVTRLAARLGRHTLLVLARFNEELHGKLSEPVVIDHFETFEFSQDLPFGVATPVGASSHFCFPPDPAPHARAGKITPAQKARVEARPQRPSLGGYEGSFARTLDRLRSLCPQGHALEIRCDALTSYLRAHDKHPHKDAIRLRSFPNLPRGPKGSPRSEAARARDRAMFPCDHLHALVRHSAAHHRRETIAFGRRINALLERFGLLLAWKNFIKGLSERKPDPTTPAMKIGLTDEPWTWRRVFSQRLFPHREKLSQMEWEIYRRDLLTPVLPANTRHRLKHAF